MRPPVPILTTVVTLVTLGATGCTRVGGGAASAPSPPPPTAAAAEADPVPEHWRYLGVAHIAGDRFAVELDLTERDPSGVGALLWIDALGLEAAGHGRATAERLELSLTYGGSCEGTLTVSARLTDGGRRGDGRIEAADCTGTAAGPLELERRDATPIIAPGRMR